MTTLSFDAYWRDHGVQAGLKGISGHADKATSSFSRFSGGAAKGLLGVGGAALKFGAVGAGALAAVGVAGIGMGVKVASGNEQARISFTTMLGSAKRADAFLRQLQKFAASTPFEFPELQTASASLIAAGINADKIIPIMRTLGDVTSGVGTGSEGVKQATVALQKMTAAGKVTGEGLEQLRTAGIPVYDLLAAATGKSKAEVVKLAQAGKLGQKELGAMMQALESGKGLERFSGLMEKQSKSLSGMVSTLKDTLGQGLAEAVEPAFPLIKSGLAGVTKGAEAFSKMVADNKGALTSTFKAGSSLLKSFGSISLAAFKAFGDGISGGRASFKDFAAWLSTHQGDITAGMVAGGKGAIAFGKVLAQMASTGLRAFAFLMDAQAQTTKVMLSSFRSVTAGAALAYGWIPGIGPKLKAADASFAAFSATAISGMGKAAKGARSAADGIDGKLIPALDDAGASLDKVGKKQIMDARARDSIVKAGKAISAIGTASNGSQIKLKKFSDISKLSADEQRKLRGRLSDAKTAMRQQTSAMRDAEKSQDKLTEAWKKGRERLYKEFVQMGLSKREARRLANEYAGIPPKVKTKVEQPGMASARRNARGLDSDINGINNKTVKVRVQFGASGKISIGGGPKFTAATGGIMPGYSPGRDIHTFVSPTGGVLQLSGGEPVMRPEFGKVVGRGWVDSVNRAARTGGTAGVRRALQRQALADGGVYNDITVRGSTSGKVPVHRAYNTAVDAARWAGGKSARWAGERIVKWVKKKSAEDSGGGLKDKFTGIGHGAAGIRRIARAYNASYIAGHRDPQGGPAFDIGSSGSKNRAIRNALRVNHGAIGARYVIGQMQIASARSGWRWRGYHPMTNRGDFRHVNHVHVSYDQGGILHPGSSGVNLSGRPERVLSPDQTQRFENLVGILGQTRGKVVNQNINITVKAPNYVGPQRELLKALHNLERLGALNGIARSLKRRA